MQNLILTQNFNPNQFSQIPSQVNSDNQFIELFLKNKNSLKTRIAYKKDISDFTDFVNLDKVSLRMMTLTILENYKEKLLNSNLKTSSVCRKLAAIKSLFAFGVKIGWLAFDIGRVVNLPKFKNEIAKRYLPAEIIAKIIEVETDLRNKLYFKLSYLTGARVSEICNLAWEDFRPNQETCTITIFGKGSKTRFVLIPIRNYLELLEIKENSENKDKVFKIKSGQDFSRHYAWEVCQKMSQKLKESGIDVKFSPHFFRHSHATRALANGANLVMVKNSLGHANLASTEMYLHINPADGSGLYLGKI